MRNACEEGNGSLPAAFAPQFNATGSPSSALLSPFFGGGFAY